jgi:hypothetical protein
MARLENRLDSSKPCATKSDPFAARAGSCGVAGCSLRVDAADRPRRKVRHRWLRLTFPWR